MHSKCSEEAESGMAISAALACAQQQGKRIATALLDIVDSCPVRQVTSWRSGLVRGVAAVIQ